MDVNHFYGDNRRTSIPWFNQSQWDTVPEWFHGVTSRKDAEALLMCKPPGYFLVRVGESRNGFTLSYRATDRCRHFMIDALQDGNYTLTGESTRHRSLQDLVDFHSRTPIMPFNEALTVPCIKISEDTERDEDIPPALPHRTALPAIPTLLTPPYHTDLPPNGFNSHPPDQGSHYELWLQPPVNAMEPTALPGLAHIYNSIPAVPASDIPAEVPSHRETDNIARLYPTLPYPPFTSSPSTEQSAAQDKRAEPNPNPNPKFLAMPSQVKVMALFRKKKRESQESPQPAEADPSGAPRRADDALPEEYLHPPPYAPGYY
ncbi:hematopoietic SH2 domain-containing protein homolog [Gadus morhua]|uniref:Hematopoietic SH2 domain containing n=1 Tax=Gadus morhua TaxID=8049 RepID=A0A8C5C701_GADMO|nr:hematopoietic SH2 domain-containing protein [Gadus morhua]